MARSGFTRSVMAESAQVKKPAEWEQTLIAAEPEPEPVAPAPASPPAPEPALEVPETPPAPPPAPLEPLEAPAADLEPVEEPASDLRADLKRLKRDTSTGNRIAPVPAALAIPPPATLPLEGRTGHRRWKFALISVALAAPLALLAWWAIRRGEGPAPGSAQIAVAVLPFQNTSGDPNAEYLSDGIAESLINSLSKLPQLRVVPRSVVAGYKGREIDPRKVGEELNVRAIVTGRLSRHGDIISIQADLIDLQNVAQLWGQHYDHKVSDVLLVQDDISRNIFENLRLKLNVEEKKKLEAYGLYLKGRNAWNKRTEDGLRQGIDYFQQAIQIDPNYAPAYAGLADCYNMLVVYGVQQPKDAFPKAKEALRCQIFSRPFAIITFK